MMERAPDFKLMNDTGQATSLADLLAKGPVMLVFFPGAFTPVCTKQLCDYRDATDRFDGIGIQMVGVSADAPEKLKEFRHEYGFKFPLLSDPGHAVLKQYGGTSKWLFGAASRAIAIVSKGGDIVYRHVEATPITRRRSEELNEVLAGLKAQNRL